LAISGWIRIRVTNAETDPVESNQCRSRSRTLLKESSFIHAKVYGTKLKKLIVFYCSLLKYYLLADLNAIQMGMARGYRSLWITEYQAFSPAYHLDP
jgi:hypothetical protein